MWLKFEEIQQLGLTPQWIRKKVATGEWTCRGTGQRGRNGKEIKEVLLESLPTALQLKWATAKKPESIEELPVEEKPETSREVTLTIALQRYAPEERDAFLQEALRLQSIVQRYAVINPKRAKDAAGKLDFVPEVLRLCEQTKCTDPIVLRREPAKAKAVSAFTLDRWANSISNLGLAIFLRKPQSIPAPSQDKRKAIISAPAIEWANENWKRYPSPRHFYRAIEKKAKKEQWIIPAESYFRRRFNSLPEVVSTLVFQGEKAYNSRLSPFVPRTVEDLSALQILCGDHSVRDVTVMLPDGSLTRPWLTIWYCLRTGLIWGYHLDLVPSSNTIGLAYANGVQNFGAQPLSDPSADFYSYLYTDQGKDYKCKTITGETLTFKNAARIEGGMDLLCSERRVGFLDELGLKRILARGYNAKEKPVERVHRVISDWEENTFEDEYCGRDAKNKPDRWVENWKKHQKLKAKFKGNIHYLRQESPFMTFDDYRENLVGWINEFNHVAHIRSVIDGSPKLIPIEEYNRLYTTRYEISNEALALFLMKWAKRKIDKNGIKIFNYWYLHEEMSEHKKQEVELRYSDNDYSRIWVILPSTPTKPTRIVEASMITRSSILRPNKETMAQVKAQQAIERNLVKDFRFLQESNARGATAEDRVAAQLIQPEEVSMPQVIAVGERPASVHQLTRFDAKRIGRTVAKNPSVSDIAKIEQQDNIFALTDRKPAISEWETGGDADE